MALLQYTPAQLHRLRDSPLVKKPDNLPAIEQWIEYVYVEVEGSREKLRIPHSESTQQQQHQKESNNAKQRVQRTNGTGTGDTSPMGNFSTGQRPSLIQTRSAFSRSGDDIVLGPPKTAFASSRTLSRFADANDKASTPPSDSTPVEEPESARARTFAERQNNRKSLNTNEGESRANRESWTSARERRQQTEQDESKPDGAVDRNGRYNNRRDRDKEQDGEQRRNGFGDKQDRRWGNRDDTRGQNGERQQGGWREREKERRENRGYGRNEDEKEPEWFDEPAALKKQEDDLGMGNVRTQEDFQKWKDMMNARNKPEEPPDKATAEPLPVKNTAQPPKPTSAPIKLDSILDKPFGDLSQPKSAVEPSKAMEGLPTPVKPSAGKGKSSRFASMFKKPEDTTPTSAEGETKVQQLANEIANGSSEDKEGFQRILQMLGGADGGGISLGQPTPASNGNGDLGFHQSAPPLEPTSPPPKTDARGSRQRSRFFDSTPMSPERLQSPPQSAFQPQFKSSESDSMLGHRGMTEEPSNAFGGRLPEKPMHEQPRRLQPPVSAMSPDPMPAMFGMKDQGPAPGRKPEIARDDPPSRGAGTPDVGIQNLLAARSAQRQQAPNKDSEFLLGLLQGQTSRPSSQQARPPSSQQIPRPGRDYPLWLEQPPEPHAPKPRQPPPPGLIDEHLLRNQPQDMPGPEPERQQYMTGGMPVRRTSQRVPPPGFDDQSLFLQQQQQHHRRHFTEPPQQHHQPQSQHQPPLPGQGRRMSGHPNLPHMQTQQQPQYPPDFPFLQSPVPGVHQQGPPPGFPPNMRHPQGFANIPNIFQAAQPQQQQQREPPGFGGGMMQQPMSPPNVPPGFGVPGIPPGLMQMRGAPRGYEGFEAQRR